MTLEQNYRSTQPILDVTNTLISRARERYYEERCGPSALAAKPPWLVAAQDERQQTRFVVDRILELHEEGTPLREIAVLFRAGYMSADLEIELTNRKIPFEKWGGLKFLEAAHVKDVLAFLRILENPRDEVSWYRILLLHARDRRRDRARRDRRHGAARRGTSSAFGRYAPPPRARAAHGALVELLDELRSGADARRGARSAPKSRASVGSTTTFFASATIASEPRLADLDQLQAIAAGYPDRATSSLRARARATAGDAGSRRRQRSRSDDVLVLSTAHQRERARSGMRSSSSGRWTAGSRHRAACDSEEETEEERRLMYVAMTRARNTWP